MHPSERGAVALRAGTAPHAGDAPSAPARHDDEARLGAALLWHARDSIAGRLRAVHERPRPGPDARLAERGSTFVTLQRDGALRGCIGSLEPSRALEHDVRHNAAAAAFHDPRFEPVTEREWPALRVEVSLLHPARRLEAADEGEALARLVPDVDGVVLQWRGARATFLPQVWSQVRDAAEFLRLLKRKAGLPAGFWASDVALWRYTVSKWAEPAPDARGDAAADDVPAATHEVRR